VELPPLGILNIAKPAGMTSRDVVNKIQRPLKPVKVGHCGTLDPMATGVLLVCVGSATRLVSLIQERPKTYEAIFQLGLRTDSEDITGKVLEERPVPTLSLAELDQHLNTFRGTISQIPPQVSAVHVDGQRAYDLVRKGVAVDLKPRTVTISELTLDQFDGTTLQLTMTCSSGTYVRSVARDLGEQIGCGATMTNLVRSQIGSFKLTDALELNDLDSRQKILDAIQPVTPALSHLPRVCLHPVAYRLLYNGMPLPSSVFTSDVSPETATDSLWCLLHENGSDVLGLARWDYTAHAFRPEIVFRDHIPGIE
jgi:tRNA pseudouridine55 synthase